MGHGSSRQPAVATDERGFVVTDIYLAMPWQWELRFDLKGSVTDHALATFDIQ